jgi:hypothetical protein
MDTWKPNWISIVGVSMLILIFTIPAYTLAGLALLIFVWIGVIGAYANSGSTKYEKVLQSTEQISDPTKLLSLGFVPKQNIYLTSPNTLVPRGGRVIYDMQKQGYEVKLCPIARDLKGRLINDPNVVSLWVGPKR